MARITLEEIERARAEAVDPPAQANRGRIRLRAADVERHVRQRVLDRVKPSNFHHGKTVGARTMTFTFNAPRGEYRYELKVNGRRYVATRKNKITILFKNVRLMNGCNVLKLTIPGASEVSRQFAIDYDFAEAPYYGRFDPVTQRKFTADDDVVRCRRCLQYSLRTSWQSPHGPCPYSTLPNSRCQNHQQGFFSSSDQGFAAGAT